MKTKIVNWVDEHDDRWSFIIFYVGLSVLLSIFMSLFWVALLMLAHLALETVRHIMLGMDRPFLRSLWRVKLDIALVFFALVIGLYADTIMAALGLGYTARAAQAARSSQLVTRFAVVQRGLRVVMMTMDDMTRLTGAVFRTLSGRRQTVAQAVTQAVAGSAQNAPYDHDDPAILATRGTPPWQSPERGDWFSLGFGALCLLLIFCAPLLTKRDYHETLHSITTQFTP